MDAAMLVCMSIRLRISLVKLNFGAAVSIAASSSRKFKFLASFITEVAAQSTSGCDLTSLSSQLDKYVAVVQSGSTLNVDTLTVWRVNGSSGLPGMTWPTIKVFVCQAQLVSPACVNVKRIFQLAVVLGDIYIATKNNLRKT